MKIATLLITTLLGFGAYTPSAVANPACAMLFAPVPERVRLMATESTKMSAEDLRDFAVERYGWRAAEPIISGLKAMGPQFLSLVVDAGLMLRREEFSQFVEENHLERASAWSARQQFAESLGYRRVYRSLVLTEAEHQAILKNGIEANVIRNQVSAKDLHVILRKKLTDVIDRRVNQRDANQSDTLLSVSDVPEIAAGIAENIASSQAFQTAGFLSLFFNSSTVIGKQTYLYELQVPEIDLLYRGPRLLPYLITDLAGTLEVSASHKTKTYDFRHRDVESFIVLKADPSEILSSRVVTPGERARLTFKKR